MMRTRLWNGVAFALVLGLVLVLAVGMIARRILERLVLEGPA